MVIIVVRDAHFTWKVTVTWDVHKMCALLDKFKEWEDSAKTVEMATLSHQMENHVTKSKT